jgi:guanylate kinase
MKAEGDIFVISAPSGTGKSTFIKRAFDDLPGLVFSISYTTRPPREGEAHGKDYFFIDGPTFDKMLAENGFIEWVQVYQNRYGTGNAWIHEQLAKGRDVLLDLETAGAMRVKELFPAAVLIFLAPPSADALSGRLQGRGKDSEEQISIRMAHAKHEMERWGKYDYIILNDDLETAYKSFKAIFLAARASRKRMAQAAQAALESF